MKNIFLKAFPPKWVNVANVKLAKLRAFFRKYTLIGLLIIVFVPPVIFYNKFVSDDLGKVPIIPLVTCGGEYLVQNSEYGVADQRLYDSPCIDSAVINTEEIISKAIAQSLGPFYAILENQVCFNTKSTIDSGDNIPESEPVKEVVLEDMYVSPRTIRIEYRPGYGIDVEDGGCTPIPFDMKGELSLRDGSFRGSNKIKREYFDILMNDKMLTEVSNEDGIYKNRLFIEDTNIYAIPRNIHYFIFLIFLAAWIPIILATVTLYKHLKTLSTQK